MTTHTLTEVRTSNTAGPESRAARKERTRKALIDGTLELLADRSFASVSLREVARAADIVPTAFYRHFASLEELGVVLVEESMRVLRQMLRDARRTTTAKSASDSLAILVRQVSAHEAQFRFLSRERYGGVPEVRRAIATEMRIFASELTIDLSRMPAMADWTNGDLEMAADLIVSTMFSAVVDLLEAGAPGTKSRAEVVEQAERQLRLIMLGMAQWAPRH
ncbi:TetR family transcriptional regulator [Rhodococcus triatomae]|uniref:DNA-binding transcriptional regulator, AcrR family n=1 Tax=Rhodococcus triatomae TaxID=300028 RepID=A0A1G8DY26_9NOCA|nr:TetR family transcriptional regulator [Rhodococcus triatomae]QNG18324.1 TetR family transcriptional regulator [Rhodococcus triatomae]QNG22006.1 TetR family transcriptional regulator [Rhodococcus triatomae]SDH62370.1 DNA-binding transcriptional regulator, AcrR family [Rhodococcus triatomae]